MNAISNQLLTLVLAYGYPIIGLFVLISSVGIPFPSVIIVLAAGSLAAIGDLNIFALFFLVTACGVFGDVLDYYLGAKVGHTILQGVDQQANSSTKWISRVQKYFFRWSGITIFLTRWLFSMFASVISLLAGTTKYSFRKFLIFDILGQVISSIMYLGVGYLFSTQWQNIWTYIQSISELTSVILVGVLLMAFGIKNYNKFSNKKDTTLT